MKDLIEFIAKRLVNTPEKIVVNEIAGNQTTVIELKVPPEELGRVIGRQGRTAKALRTILSASALKSGKKVILEILENQDA